MTWYVCDMDDGILRIEPTLRAAKQWTTLWVGEAIHRTRRVCSGIYEVDLGDNTQVTIAREDMLDPYGLTPDHRAAGAMYPDPDDPYEARA